MSNLSENDVAILAAKRLKMPDGQKLPALQTMVQNALSNLARQVANDPQRRAWMMSNPDTATAGITSTQGRYYADLSTLLADPQLMLEYLQYGTVYCTATNEFTSSNVTGNNVTISDNGYIEGDAVMFSNSGGALPSPLAPNTVYYTDVKDAETFSLFYDAALEDEVTLNDAGTGIQTIFLAHDIILQWLGSPNQGAMTACLPLNYVYCWLVDKALHVKGRTAGTLAFNVPFVASLDSLNAYLETDLIDNLVSLAISSGYQELTPAQK